MQRQPAINRTFPINIGRINRSQLIASHGTWIIQPILTPVIEIHVILGSASGITGYAKHQRVDGLPTLADDKRRTSLRFVRLILKREINPPYLKTTRIEFSVSHR